MRNISFKILRGFMEFMDSDPVIAVSFAVMGFFTVIGSVMALITMMIQAIL